MVWNCDCCYEPLDLVENNGSMHMVCLEEYNRREKEGLCVRCGKDSVIENTKWCKACDSETKMIGFKDIISQKIK